ncbi:C39 family peptidase [bacterium]|nr:C39 family peptidase [bacterium]
MRRIIALTIVMCLLCSILFGAGIWLNVPFIAQERKGCGAAVIAMVMSYWTERGFPIEAEKRDAAVILRTLYSKENDGILASDLEAYFLNHGYRTFAFRGSLQDLEHHLRKGRPLIVALQLNSDSGPRHYVVVVGMSRSEDVVLVNDSSQRKLMKINREKFEKGWSRNDFWTLLALPQ